MNDQPISRTPGCKSSDFYEWLRERFGARLSIDDEERMFAAWNAGVKRAQSETTSTITEPPRDPDTGELRPDLEAISERVYERLYAQLRQRGICLPGCDTTDKALTIIEQWAINAVVAQSRAPGPNREVEGSRSSDGITKTAGVALGTTCEGMRALDQPIASDKPHQQPKRWRVKKHGDDLITYWKSKPRHSNEYAAAEIIEELERDLTSMTERWQLQCADAGLARLELKEMKRLYGASCLRLQAIGEKSVALTPSATRQITAPQASSGRQIPDEGARPAGAVVASAPSAWNEPWGSKHFQRGVEEYREWKAKGTESIEGLVLRIFKVLGEDL